VAWLVGTLMVGTAATMGYLLTRVERVRIQPPQALEPVPQRRRSDGAPV
jgi:hypothetical protein